MAAITLSKVREALAVLGIATKDGVETIITPTEVRVRRFERADDGHVKVALGSLQYTVESYPVFNDAREVEDVD